MTGLFMFGNARPINAGSAYQVEVEHDGLGAAMYESWCEYHDIRGRAEVALVSAYENYIMNTKQTEDQKVALFEGVLGDVWEKIKAFFRKVAEKIKSWWNAAVKFFQSHFQNDEEFLKKYKDEITGRDISKFTCTMHEWPKFSGGLGAISELTKGVDTSIKTGEVKFNTIVDGKNTKDTINDAIKNAKKDIDKEAYSHAKGAAPGTDSGNGGMGKFKKAVTETYRGKEKEKKGLSGLLSVASMIAIIENGKDAISDIKEAADKIADAADGYADKVDATVKKLGDSDEKKGESTRIVNGAIEVAKYSLSYATAELELAQSLTKDCMAECRSTLGAILRYKEPTKDSSSGIWGGSKNTTSLMDAFSAGF